MAPKDKPPTTTTPTPAPTLADLAKIMAERDALAAELAKRGKATVKRDTWSDAPDVAPVSFTILMDDGTTVGPYAFSRTADGASTWRENPETGKGGAYAGCKPTIGGRAFTGGLNLSPKASK